MAVYRMLGGAVLLAALIMNETVGSLPLYAITVVVAMAFLAYPTQYFFTLKETGVVTWLYPVLLLASSFWSPAPDITFRFALQVFLTLFFAVNLSLITSRRELCVIIMIVCGFVCTACLISGRTDVDGMTGQVNLVGILAQKNSLGLNASLLVLSSFAVLLSWSYNKMLRLVALPCLAVGLLTTAKSGSIGALTSLLVGLGFLLTLNIPQIFHRRWRQSVTEIIVTFGIPAFAIVGLIVYTFKGELLALVGKNETLTGRTVLWFYASRYWPDHPILGMGGAAFWRQGYAPAEFLWKAMHIASRSGFHFHSIIYQTLVETGLLGLFFMILYIGNALIVQVSTLRRNFSESSAFFLAVSLFILAIQFQGIDLMQPFSAGFVVFACASIFSKQEKIVPKILPGAQVKN